MATRFQLPDLLFRKYDIREDFRQRQEKAATHIRNLDRKYLIDTPTEDLARYYDEEFRVEPLYLDFERTEVEPLSVEVDVSRDQARFIRDRSQPYYVTLPQVNYIIPLSGERTLLEAAGDHIYLSPPRGIVRSNELVIPILAYDGNIEKTEVEFNRERQQIEQSVIHNNQLLERLNNDFSSHVRTCIANRKKVAEQEDSQTHNLSFPVRGKPATEVRLTKKRLRIAALPPSSSSYQEEMVLPMADYHEVIGCITHWGATLEKNPRPFERMGEEDLRYNILSALNATFDGIGRAEVFNVTGKTDILLQVSGRNIFIAECKVYRGKKSVEDAITQLLGYVSWRDTKAALIIFSRNVNFSDVIRQSAEAVSAHENSVREPQRLGESRFQFLFKQPNDSKRLVDLTLLVFDVPKPFSHLSEPTSDLC